MLVCDSYGNTEALLGGRLCFKQSSYKKYFLYSSSGCSGMQPPAVFGQLSGIVEKMSVTLNGGSTALCCMKKRYAEIIVTMYTKTLTTTVNFTVRIGCNGALTL